MRAWPVARRTLASYSLMSILVSGQNAQRAALRAAGQATSGKSTVSPIRQKLYRLFARRKDQNFHLPQVFYQELKIVIVGMRLLTYCNC